MNDFIDRAIAEERRHFISVVSIPGAEFAVEAAREHMARQIAQFESLRNNPRAQKRFRRWEAAESQRNVEWQAIWRAPREQQQSLREAYEAHWPSPFIEPGETSLAEQNDVPWYARWRAALVRFLV